MMATYRKRGTTWRAEIAIEGVRTSGSFLTKAAAVAWATAEEAKIRAGKHSAPAHDATFGDLLRRYAEEVSPSKRGARWEQVRIAAYCRDPVAEVRLEDLKPAVLAGWRNARLRQVTPATVARDMNLISAALTIAVREWGWLPESPIKGVRKPPEPPGRERLPEGDEMARILHVCGYSADAPPETKQARVGAAALFAIATAMRAGEICALTWADVEIERRFCRIRAGKTAAAKRDVPLSEEALRILAQLHRDGDLCFGLSVASLDALWRKAYVKAGVTGLHFHDLRHAAITQLAHKLDILALARMVGHRDLRMLQRYYNESAESLAARL